MNRGACGQSMIVMLIIKLMMVWCKNIFVMFKF